MLSHNNRDYCKEIIKIRNKNRSSSCVINGCNDRTDIANEFACKYNVLYNSVTSDPADLQSMALSIRKDIITTSESTDHSFSRVITVTDIKYDCFIHGSDSLYAFLLCYLMLCYYTGHFQIIFGVYFNTDTKRITCGCMENSKLPCNYTEQYSW